MEIKNLVICDEDEEYMQSLLEHLTNLRNMSLQVYICKGVEKAVSLMKSIEIDYLFISSNIQADERGKIKSKSYFVLTESDHCELGAQETPVFKYQSIDDILDIFLKDEHRIKERRTKDTDVKLIGIYSPADKIAATTYAARLSAQMGAKHSLLYITTQVHIKGYDIFSKDNEKNIIDLLYFFRQEHKDLKDFLQLLAQDYKGFDIIAPAEISDDIKEVPTSDWMGVLKLLLDESYYEVIVLDIGEGTRGISKIISLCDEVHIPVISSPHENLCISQFEKELVIIGEGETLKKITRKEIRM